MLVCKLRSSRVREFRLRRAVIIPLVTHGELAEFASLAQLPLQGLRCQISCLPVIDISVSQEESIPLFAPAAR